VEESRITKNVHGAIHSTYFGMILKRDKMKSFMDFRSIALCNMTHQIMMKIIALRIKPSLAEMVTKEQFSFLPNKKIMGAIGIAKEYFHSIKKNVLIFKMDLIKPYDWVDCGFLCMLLLQIGLPF